MVVGSTQVKAQRRGEETKFRLIQETKSLLAKFDYQSLTLDQIASGVGVAKSSILWHFGNKETLLTEAVFDLFEEINEKLKFNKANLETFDQRIRYLLESVAEYFIHNPEAKGIAIALLFNNQVPDSVRDRIREQWDEQNRQICDFVSLENRRFSKTGASALMALMHGCYLQWHLSGCKHDLKKDLVKAYESLMMAC